MALQAPGGLIQGRIDVRTRAVGPNLPPAREADDLDAMAPLRAHARVVLEDHLDLDPLHAAVEARDPSEPALRDGPVVLRDVGPSALEYEIHHRLPGKGFRLADLVFGPTLAC